MTNLPPLPTSSESRNTGGVSSPAPAAPPSAFSGGMSSMMSAMQQVESGLQMLAQQVPSLAPMCAETISKFRVALPTALAQAAGVQPGASAGMPGMGMDPNSAGLPGPPMGV